MITISNELTAALAQGVEAWLASRRRLCGRVHRYAFTQFGAEDAETLYHLRYHPTVLDCMPGTSAIPFADHMAWVRRSLVDQPGAVILIARDQQQAVGFVSIKPVAEPGTVEIGEFILGPHQRGLLPMAIGFTMLYLALDLFRCEMTVSQVSPDNKLAMSINDGNRFVAGPSTNPDKLQFSFSRQDSQSNRNYQWLKRRLDLRFDEIGADGEGAC